MSPTSPLVDQLSDNAIFARELGFIREIEILAALEASGMITTSDTPTYTRIYLLFTARFISHAPLGF